MEKAYTWIRDDVLYNTEVAFSNKYENEKYSPKMEKTRLNQIVSLFPLNKMNGPGEEKKS